MKNKKVLIISYWYPPLRAIGSLRVGKFSKYLPEFGWEPIVVTVEPRSDRFTRKGRLPDEIRYGRVYRTRDLSFSEIIYTIASRLRSSKDYPLQPIRETHGQVKTTAKCKLKNNLREMALWIYRQFLCFPDEAVLWLLEYSKIERIALKERPDIIFSSSLPNTSHIIASRLIRRLNIPWIADFRDLWTQNHVLRRIFPLRSLEVWLERRTLEPASALVTVSEPLKAQLEELHNKPVYVITNGFDPDDFPKKLSLSMDSHGPLRIVYTGIIYPGKQDPSPLFAALEDLLRRGRIESGDVQVEFYGRRLDVVWEILEHYPTVRSMVRLKGEVSYQQALQVQCSADVLLLLEWTDPQARGVYTGKVFEYLGAQRPILSIGPAGGVIEELLEKTRAGVHVQSAEEIKLWLERWLEEKRKFGKPSYAGRPEVIWKYTRKEQTRKLAEILDKVLEEGS